MSASIHSIMPEHLDVLRTGQYTMILRLPGGERVSIDLDRQRLGTMWHYSIPAKFTPFTPDDDAA